MVALSLITDSVQKHQLLLSALQQVTAQFTVWLAQPGEFRTNILVNPFQKEYITSVTGIKLEDD